MAPSQFDRRQHAPAWVVEIDWQNSLSHGKTFFLTAKLSFSRQNFLSHGKTFFLTAKLFLSAELFLMAKRSFVEYNIRSEEKTCSESEGKERYIWLMREIQSASFANTSPLRIFQKVHTPKIVTFLTNLPILYARVCFWFKTLTHPCTSVRIFLDIPRKMLPTFSNSFS